MATTQAQRASLFNTLTELMGTEDAETFMQQLPPSGWDSMATKDDLQVLGATFAAALAEFRVEVTTAFADLRVDVTNALAEAAKERAEIRIEVTNALAEAAKERAEIITANSESHSDLVTRHSDLVMRHSELVESYAGLVKSQARHLYITVSTIVVATISIWIALLTVPAGG